VVVAVSLNEVVDVPKPAVRPDRLKQRIVG
jgi:hypothetical protein